ncbi:hypothetical protein [Pyxidicoccus trucidator]|uniref:hypothetical protein n=1 Tax=Pyxidicoccus trucidator TaxID=2709662 RepID=UPI0013DA679C|nr:hypothetical protein [Pyxidicoccus trucidator]
MTAGTVVLAALLTGCMGQKRLAEAWPPADAPAPALPSSSASPAAVPPGTFAEYELEGYDVAPMLVTFTVLEERESERLVEVRARPRGPGPLSGPLQRPLVFVMRLEPLPGEALRLPSGRNAAADRIPEPGHDSAHPFEVRPAKVEVGGGTFECARVEHHQGANLTRGCVGATDARIAFAGGAVWLEEAWSDWAGVLSRARLVAHGVRTPGPRDAVVAVRPGQVAVYDVWMGQEPSVETHVWSTGHARVRHSVSGTGTYHPLIESQWEGTLLDVVFLLARLEPGRNLYAREAAPAERSVVQVGDARVGVILRSLAGRSAGDVDFTQQLTLAEDPWGLKDAPVWGRFWPLVSMTDMKGGHTIRIELKEWK